MMKKYSFILWILLLALVLGGGYYFLENYGKNATPQEVVDGGSGGESEAPSEPSETPSAEEEPSETEETPVALDAIDKLKVKKPFSPEFTIYNGENEEVTLADYKGKKVILNFWASWCPPCVFEMPEFQALHEVLNPEETVLLAVNLTDGQRETKALADKFIEENDLTLNVLYDTTGSAFYEFKVSSIPQTFIIDEEGIVQYAIMGMTDKKTLDSILERME